MPNTKSSLIAAVALAVFAAAPACRAQTKLQSVISQMNAASAKFTSAQADLRQELFTKAVDDTEVRYGQIYFLRKGGETQMGMKMLAPDAKPGSAPSQIVEFKDGKLRMLTVGTGQVDEFSASGKNQSLAETMMTLGFGGSGADLQRSWTITDLGADQINDGSRNVPVEKLDLVSKDPGIRSNYSHIVLWIDPVRDVSLKQQLFEADGGKPSGNTRTVFYTNIRLNQHVDTGAYAIKCPGKCTVVTH